MKRSAFRRKILLESEIQSATLDYLMPRKNFVLWLNNIPAFSRNDDGSIGMRRLPKGARRGMNDLLIIHAGRPLFLEVKRPGGYESAELKQFQNDALAAGASHAVVRSIEDAQKLGL